MLGAVACLGRAGTLGAGCEQPATFDEAGMAAFASCASESDFVGWAAKYSMDADLARKAYRGELSWRDAVATYARHQGFHGDPTKVVRKDGSIDWEEASGQGGAFAAYAACASEPATAPLAPLCSEGGYYGGKALYNLAGKGYNELKNLDFWNWSFGGTKEPPRPYNVSTERADIIGLIAREYRDNGYLDYLMNVSMLQGVVYQYYALARSIEIMRGQRGLRAISGEQALTEAGYAPPIGYAFLLSSSNVTPPPPPEPGGRWWRDWNLLEHELLQAVSGDVPAPKFLLDPLPAATYDANGMVRDADFDTFSIEHTNQAFLVRCAGQRGVYGNNIGLPKRADGTLPAKAEPLFKALHPSPYHGGEASSGSCYDKWVSVRARVYFDPHVRAFADRDRDDALAIKDVMLVLLQGAASKAISNALSEKPPLGLVVARGGLAPTTLTLQPGVIAPASATETCDSYATSNKSDFAVAALFAAGGALAGKVVPQVGGVKVGAVAGAVVGISYLLGARSTWRKNHQCP